MSVVRRVEVRGAGGPEVLHLVPVDVGQPGRGEVRVAVQAAGVAFGDVMRRRGVMAPRKPFTPGYDFTGVVDAVGPDVDASWIGRRVAAMMPSVGFGAYSEQVVLPVARLATVPDGVEPHVAAALGLNYITARQLLTRFAPVTDGQTVLVHGVAGGVGTAVLDLCRGTGVRVFGTASAKKHGLVEEYGGIPIDYRTEDFVQRVLAGTDGRGADMIIDGIGGQHLFKSYEALAADGTLVSLGVSGDVGGGMWGVVKGVTVYLRLKLWPDGKRVKMYLISLSKGAGWNHCRDDYQALLDMAAKGQLTPVIGQVVPFSEVREAHDLVDRAAVVGKVVLSF